MSSLSLRRVRARRSWYGPGGRRPSGLLLVLALPVSKIESLSTSTKLVEGCRFTAKDQSVLNTWRETFVVSSIEGLIVVTQEYTVLVEFDVVTGDVMMVFHNKIIEFCGSRRDGIGFPERGLESLFKGIPIGSVTGKGTSGKHKIRFVPTKCSTLEPGNGVGDLNLIVCEIVWATSEREMTLG